MLSVPATAGSGASLLAMLRIGSDVTVVVIAVPGAGAVSLLSMAYDPFVITVPFARGLVTCTTIWTLPEAPAARFTMFQVTTPPASVPPPVAETNAVLTGTVSVTTTPVALAFPVFE